MGWLPPYTQLDAQQKEFVDNVDINKKNIWIKGFPGSGKSVLLAYTFQRILTQKPKPKIAMIVFTHSLINMFKAALNEIGIDINIMTYIDFKHRTDTYDYILCDEVQDLTGSVLSAMKQRAKHVIVAGDENQSIFKTDPSSGEATVAPTMINNLLASNSYQLNVIHRLSSSIINAVTKFLPQLNLFEAKRDMSKSSTQIRLCQANNDTEEADYIYKESIKAVNIGETVAILIPTQNKIVNFVNTLLLQEYKPIWYNEFNQYQKLDMGSLNQHLEQNNINIQYVGNGYGTLGNNKITIMTYHSAKGLDFDHVFIPMLDSKLFISRDSDISKTLFMVAMTRSRKNLYLTHCGEPHSYVKNFTTDCNKINIHDLLSCNNIIKNKGLFGGI